MPAQVEREPRGTIEAMSLLDWFAGQALIAIMSGDEHRGVAFEDRAKVAYISARAMMRERAKQQV